MIERCNKALHACNHGGQVLFRTIFISHDITGLSFAYIFLVKAMKQIDWGLSLPVKSAYLGSFKGGKYSFLDPRNIRASLVLAIKALLASSAASCAAQQKIGKATPPRTVDNLTRCGH